MTRPVALSCGDPSGIGPEIAVAAWTRLRGDLPFIWIGDPRHLPDGTPFREIASPDDATRLSSDVLPVLPNDFAEPALPGQPHPANAAGIIKAIDTAVDLAQSGDVAAICTAPIHKKALINGAGFAFPGHTEYLAHLAGVDRVVMMLVSDELRVVPATIHIPLSEVPSSLTKELLTETLTITEAGLRRWFAIERPRIAVAGLNPHAGEGGVMGDEERTTIVPVLERLRASGMMLDGPRSADTLFHAEARNSYDAAVAMYHDQALIPIKTLAFDTGVNMTLGLPFLRTSPDHGTAYDIAGKGVARPESLISALTLAARLAASEDMR